MENSSVGHKGEIWMDTIESPNYGVYIVFASSVLFLILSKITMFLIPSIALRSPWRWKNISLSFVHSVITSLWAVYCFYERPDMAEDLITIFTPLSHSLGAFSVGYFLYDFCDMVVNQRTRQSFELMGHHLVVIVCFSVAVITRHYVGYMVVALLAELNSIFLHTRQLLQISGVSKFSLWYRLNSVINLGTFIPFRILLMTWMTRWLVINKDHVPLVFYTMGSIGLAVMVAMQIILFYRLFRSDFISAKEHTDSHRKAD